MSYRTMLVRTATALTAVATTGTAFAAPSAFAATATVNASCVAPYSLDTNVGVTVIDWSGAPTGAQVKVTGYGTDLRPAPTPSGSVLLPGLPLDKPALEGSPGHQGYQAYLIDAGGGSNCWPSSAYAVCADPAAGHPPRSRGHPATVQRKLPGLATRQSDRLQGERCHRSHFHFRREVVSASRQRQG